MIQCLTMINTLFYEKVNENSVKYSKKLMYERNTISEIIIYNVSTQKFDR
jgi:hypothetical protein